MPDGNAIELLEARKQELLEQGQAILSAADTDKRELTDDEADQMEGLLKEQDKVDRELTLRRETEAKAIRAAESQERKSQPEEPRNRPARQPDDDSEVDSRSRRVSVAAQPKASGEGRHGFRTFGDFAAAVYRGARPGGVVDKRLMLGMETRAPTTFGNEDTGSAGGFAVPPDFKAQIMSMVAGEDSLMSRCDQIITSGNTLSVPIDMDTAHSSSGITTYWVGENDQLSQSAPLLEQVNLRLNKLTVLVPMTEELLEDSTAINSYVPRKVGEKMDFKINLAIVQGTGTGQPLGILNSPCLVSVAQEGSQNDTIVYNNISKMWARLYPRSRGNSVWLINPDIEHMLRTLSFEGTSSSVPAYMPPGGLNDSPYGMLMGRPVLPTEACETLGDVGDIILADLSKYLIALKGGGVRAETSMHLWFDYDTTAFRFIFRVAGQPWWSAAYAGRDNTSSTYSPFVTLAVRAG